MAQGAQFLYGASTEITNDHGEQIDKQYLISKIKSVGASVKEIQEGFQSLDDGLVAPDDPGAAKLIADQNKLSDVIDDVSGKFPESVAKVKAAFDYYVRTVIDRNTQILTFNSIVIEMVKTSADLVHAQQRIQDLNDASLTASEANWPDVTAYVSCLYYKAREFILKEFDNAARAYQFWAINDEDILGPALGERTPPKIDYNALNNGFVSLREKYVDAVEDFGTDPDSFDSILLSLTAEQVSTLTLCRSVMVSIPPVRSWTTSDDNPFYGLTDVRITGVRVWLTFADGATYQGDVQIELTHSGPEQIVSPNDELFNFMHEPIHKTFRYNIGTKKVTTAPSFGSFKQGEKYGLVGPFTKWRIQVLASENTNLDISTVTGVTMQFSGGHRSFSKTLSADRSTNRSTRR